MKGKLIQIKEASDILGVSKLTLRNWDNAGKLKAYRHPINNYRVYRSEDIDRIMETLLTVDNSTNLLKSTKSPLSSPKDSSKSKVYNLKVLHIKD